MLLQPGFTSMMFTPGIRITGGRDVVNSIDHKDAAGKQLLDEAELYCGKKDGKIPGEIEEGRSFYLSLSYFIDDLVTTHLQQKEDVRFRE